MNEFTPFQHSNNNAFNFLRTVLFLFIIIIIFVFFFWLRIPAFEFFILLCLTDQPSLSLRGYRDERNIISVSCKHSISVCFNYNFLKSSKAYLHHYVFGVHILKCRQQYTSVFLWNNDPGLILPCLLLRVRWRLFIRSDR